MLGQSETRINRQLKRKPPLTRPPATVAQRIARSDASLDRDLASTHGGRGPSVLVLGPIPRMRGRPLRAGLYDGREPLALRGRNFSDSSDETTIAARKGQTSAPVRPKTST